jgi:elongation factor P--beta-lysine ligase
MGNDNDAVRWQKPIALKGGISRMEVLQRRHHIKRAVRDYLDGQGFIEIDAPLLVHGASPDICIDSFKVEDRYLVSSTEYQLKRMEMAGFKRLYSLTKNFRHEDKSSVRNPEFTMLEWARVDGTMRDIENDAEYMVNDALDALKMLPVVSYQGRKINLKAPWDRIPVLEAVERITGGAMKDFEVSSCLKAVEVAGLEIKPEWKDDRDFLFSLLMDHIQPKLGEDCPVFLTEWPLFQTPSASGDGADSALACRSELFIAGLELADGFAAQTDADTQTRLFNDALALRKKEGKNAVDLDEKYLAAMRIGSPCGPGMALGFDRLVMLLCDQSEIKNVLAFGWDEV